MPRAGLSTAAVVDAAIAVVDESGADGLTVAAVAALAGVAAPSLYKHVGGLDELRTLVGVRVLEEMTDHLTAAAVGRSRGDAVAALMHAGRAYLVERPARAATMPLDPLHDPVARAAGVRQLELVLAVLQGYGLTDAAAVHAARKIRTVLHGFSMFESGGGFGLPEDLDETYRQLVAMVVADLETSS